MRLQTCERCGTPSDQSLCARHRPSSPRPRGNAFEPTRQAIADRDGWTCQLCGEPIDPRLRKPHLKALAVHHRIPRSRGGTDHPSNLEAAHADCNLERGAK